MFFNKNDISEVVNAIKSPPQSDLVKSVHRRYEADESHANSDTQIFVDPDRMALCTDIPGYAVFSKYANADNEANGNTEYFIGPALAYSFPIYNANLSEPIPVPPEVDVRMFFTTPQECLEKQAVAKTPEAWHSGLQARIYNMLNGYEQFCISLSELVNTDVYVEALESVTAKVANSKMIVAQYAQAALAELSTSSPYTARVR